jgi:hypothetical protein
VKSKEVKTGCNLAECSKEGCGSERAVLPMVMMIWSLILGRTTDFSLLHSIQTTLLSSGYCTLLSLFIMMAGCSTSDHPYSDAVLRPNTALNSINGSPNKHWHFVT